MWRDANKKKYICFASCIQSDSFNFITEQKSIHFQKRKIFFCVGCVDHDDVTSFQEKQIHVVTPNFLVGNVARVEIVLIVEMWEESSW